MSRTPQHVGEAEQIHLKDEGVSSSIGAVLFKTPSLSVRIIKRAIDIIFAVVFFLLLGWLYILLWVCVIVSSGRPGIYFQSRYGKDGRKFNFFKFRSMVSNAGTVLDEHLRKDPIARQQWNDFQKLESDPRITKFGKLIRKTSLDELPQFWSVLIGDMSIVGPRPCMISQKELYGKYWSSYCAVRPGITGLWQVSGRNNLSFQRRVELDVQYVSEISIIGDLKILLKTVIVVLTGHGSR